jgi:hypothetical protein
METLTRVVAKYVYEIDPYSWPLSQQTRTRARKTQGMELLAGCRVADATCNVDFF